MVRDVLPGSQSQDLDSDSPPDKNLQIATLLPEQLQLCPIQTANPASTEHPRHRFRNDLLSFVRNLQQDDHEIVLMGDLNEEYGADPEGMIEISTVCSLVDIFHRRLGSSPFATFIGGRTRIDYALVSARPAAAVRHCGFEPPAFRFKGDHRVFLGI
jgi:endonuclease/exonuclease/phosphatase family metal-dependent hydrolase